MTSVALVAEGSYPYVTGGVSKWTHDLILSLPEIEFTVVALWPTPGSAGEPRYPRPRNVKSIFPVYLATSELRDGRVKADDYRKLERFHEGMKAGDMSGFADVAKHAACGRMLQDRDAWELLCRLYRTFSRPDTSFPDYFWTWRATHEPVFHMLEAKLPPVDVVHCISTGYAGLLGAIQRVRNGTPLMTTEHGLYTRERAQEIADADWIPGEEQAQARRRSNLFKEWWNRMFAGMERLAYAHSDVIVSLFEANRRYQVSRGAPEPKTRVIPNGIDVPTFDAVFARRKASDTVRIGLVGRVVPIKDVKSFITSCHVLVQKAPPGLKFEIFIIGPSDEDELYGSQCREMVQLFGLSNVVTFTGKVDAREYYERLDVVVLTSLSEGLPLVILEALACGIPIVATDVGACREIIEGRTPEDRALGSAGAITAPADPQATAEAVLGFAVDAERRKTAGDIGRRRVRTHYRLEQVRESYLGLYRSLDRGRR